MAAGDERAWAVGNRWDGINETLGTNETRVLAVRFMEAIDNGIVRCRDSSG